MPVQLSGAVLKGTQVNSASPAALFAAGEQGVWFDPSDMSTMFQETSGAIPVTGYEQPVGLIFDKSKNFSIGSELVTNGTFDTDTAWTKGAGWTIESGSAKIVSAGTSGNLIQTFSTTVGKWYILRWTYTGTGGLRVSSGGLPFTEANAGTHTRYIRSDSATNSISFFTQYGATGTLDNVSIREFAGNHAFQTTAASRPVLSARYNLLTKTEQLNDTSVQRNYGTVTPNAGISPSGVNDAFLFTGNGTTVCGWDSYPIDYGSSAGLSQTMTISAKAGTTGIIRISLQSNSYVSFNVLTGQITDTLNASGSIVNQGNGWYRLSCTSTKTNQFWYWGVSLDNGVNTSNSAYLWGTDLRIANDGFGLPPYQRVGAAVAGSSTTAGTADYDTAGFPPYLRFDGVDDGMSTSSIDFSTTDEVSIFAGVRKLSDNSAIVAELSTTIGNVGSFYLVSGEDNSGRYSSSSRGTEPANPAQASLWTGNNFAPDTSVLSATHDISNDLSTIRRNTISGTNGSFDKGTGNFGNYPLYIGNRSNNSIRLNGRLYQLIIRGTQTSQSLIDAIETWTNLKTRAY